MDDKLSKKEIDTMLNALAEGEDDVDFEREKREKILEESEEVEREYDTMYYPQVDGITPTVVAEPIKGDIISRQAAIDAFQMFREYESNRTNAEWVKMIETVLNELPSIQPEAYYECPHCHDIRKRPKAFGWFECPVCGARWEVKNG